MRYFFVMIFLLAFVAGCQEDITGAVVVVDQTPEFYTPPKDPVTHEMNISSFRFSPENIVIRVGDRIKFTNNDGRRHKIVEQSYHQFESGWLYVGNSYTHTFTNTGKVIVELIDYDMEHATYRRQRRTAPVRKTGTIEVIVR